MSNVKRQDVFCILSGGIALMFLGLGYGWSVFRSSFHILYPQWSEASLSFVFSMSMICFGVGSFLCGLLLRRFPWAGVMLLGVGILCGGFCCVSLLPPQSPSLAYGLLLLFYGVMGGGGIGICYNAINSSIPRFFPKIKGTVSGILMAGYGSGALVLGMFASALIRIPAFGLLKTFRLIAGLELAVLLVCLLCFERKNRETLKSAAVKAAGNWGFRPAEVLKLPSFWILQLRNVLSYSACLIVIEQAGNLSEAFGLAATTGLVISVANGLARIPSGISCDRLGCVRTLRIGNLILVGAVSLLAALTVRQSGALSLLCFILFGLSYGITPPVSVSINEEFFGPRYRTVNYAFFSFTLAPASLAGPTVLGLLRDRFGASALLTVWLVGSYSLFALVLSFLIRKPRLAGGQQQGISCKAGKTCV